MSDSCYRTQHNMMLVENHNLLSILNIIKRSSILQGIISSRHRWQCCDVIRNLARNQLFCFKKKIVAVRVDIPVEGDICSDQYLAHVYTTQMFTTGKKMYVWPLLPISSHHRSVTFNMRRNSSKWLSPILNYAAMCHRLKIKHRKLIGTSATTKTKYCIFLYVLPTFLNVMSFQNVGAHGSSQTSFIT